MNYRKTWPLVILALLAAFIIWGCSDEDNGTGPGDPNDPQYLTFLEEFGGINEQNGGMVELSFMFIGDVFEGIPAAKSYFKPGSELEYTIAYHAASEYWYISGSSVEVDGEDTLTFTFVDSLQFKHGDNVVQYPVDDSTTSIHSVFTLNAAGEMINEAVMHHDITITKQNPGDSILVINGTGDISADLEYENIVETDTTVCSTVIDYNVGYANIHLPKPGGGEELAAASPVEELPCPQSGVLTFSGTISHACIGASESVALSGSWNVTEAFDDGVITITVTNGVNTWSITESCD